ncbi:MAG TPA: hypothetical protein VFO54_00860 [Chryseosolibacter sp.]|nr:hypothetical protein [Chryseosolibacter sp.]
MKFLSVIMFTIMACGFALGQSHEDITMISFTKQNRGYLDEVVVSRDSVHGVVENHKMPENSRNYSTAIHADDWAKLMIALKDVPLESIDGLQSPTTNRAHDGAAHSSIVITFEGGQSISHSFDDENPHPDLAPLLKALLEFRVH